VLPCFLSHSHLRQRTRNIALTMSNQCRTYLLPSVSCGSLSGSNASPTFPTLTLNSPGAKGSAQFIRAAAGNLSHYQSDPLRTFLNIVMHCPPMFSHRNEFFLRLTCVRCFQPFLHLIYSSLRCIVLSLSRIEMARSWAAKMRGDAEKEDTRGNHTCGSTFQLSVKNWASQ
jgi:hypothetical protein